MDYDLFGEMLVTKDVSGIIERQEKMGQQDLCKSERLPVRCQDYGYFKKLHTIGVKILESEESINKKIADGVLFMDVQLPVGWNIKPTDHSMWSNLVDDKGRERASIFYKAAFYDRDASIRFNRRFDISYKIEDYDRNKFGEYEQFSQPFHYEVYDFDNTILFKSDIVKTDYDYSSDNHIVFFNHVREIENKSINQCKEWLNSNYPDWENDLAYWD